MIDASDNIIGEIMYFKTVPYMDEFEIGYRLFGKGHWGKGATTEALRLLTRYLFQIKNVNRIRLCIDVENAGFAEGRAEGRLQARGNDARLHVPPRPPPRHGAVRDNAGRRSGSLTLALQHRSRRRA